MDIKIAFKVTVEKGDLISAKNHRHESMELVYFLSGTGQTMIGDDIYRIQSNCFCLIPPNTTHSQTSESDITSICLRFDNCELDSPIGLWVDADGKIKDYLEKLMEELSYQRPAYSLVTKGLATTITGLIQRAINENVPQDRKQALISKAMKIIEGKDGNLSIDEVAGQLFISKNYFRHLFTQYTGQSPIKAIINARIEHAKHLLLNTDFPIAKIAENCGVENPYYFSKMFKNITGATPSAFRNKPSSSDS
ncbi:AraC family transcriptional regulator [Tichowtungia aerotolerans]|uniref:Helix-turn-helix domain-containing protein n=1 Tax=Tichowtungia aerotolerans TaxID=2697043 RepID=A0A6P1M4R0_9BACT|nr:AraC family transcriptional regulator [Tichowtungia aerotolerans]QHI69779.1 helix-turn-helix domain-containing protein [Tichowtungia aerotolerans]